MPSELVTVSLFREDSDEPWGFSISGGKDVEERLSISDIRPKSMAEICGLKLDDILIRINGVESAELTYEEACQEIEKGHDSFEMVIERSCSSSRKISFEKSAGTFSLKLGGGGRAKKVVQESESFISNRLEMERTTTAQISLAENPVAEEPEPAAEEAQPEPEPAQKEVIVGVSDERRMHTQESLVEDPRYQGLDEADRTRVGTHDVLKPVLRKDWNCPWVKRDGRGIKKVFRPIGGVEPVKAPVKTSHQHFYRDDICQLEPHSILEPPVSEEELREMQRKFMEEQQKLVEQENQKRQEAEAAAHEHQRQLLKAQEEAAEAERKQQMLLQQEQAQEQQQAQLSKSGSNKHVHFEDEDMQAEVKTNGHTEQDPPPSAPVKQVSLDQDEPPPLETVDHSVPGIPILDTQLLKGLAEAIQAGMEHYRQTEGYEPTAEELIDVLKNLENLAAANPALYRAIVDQIRANQPLQQPEMSQEEEQGRHNLREEEEFLMEQQRLQEQQLQQEEQLMLEQQQLQQHNGHAQEVATTRETIEETSAAVAQQGDQQLFGKTHGLSKEQMARHAQRQEQLGLTQLKQEIDTHGPSCGDIDPDSLMGQGLGDDELQRPTRVRGQQLSREDMENPFYPKPMEDYDYPWAGSLKPVSNELFNRKEYGRAGQNDPGSCPWAGSLRPVGERKRQAKRKTQDDNEGNAPWMGTLRHVKTRERPAPKPHPQFKRYPDEDAPNPFRKTATTSLLNGCTVNYEEMLAKDEADQLERIRSNIREKKTVSSALLKVLMPKLLKEHQSKYEALEEEESTRIMQEILSMKIGINPDQCVEDNEEAEQMIRAITQGDIDSSVYSQMADDLENAVQKQRKLKLKKKKKVAGAS